MPENDTPEYDRSSFDLSPYAKKIDKPWGYELHWVREVEPYMGKVLHLQAGARLSLQVHDKTQHSWLMMQGRALAICENVAGELVETELLPGVGYHVSAGQKHRLQGITDCDIIEVSTPEAGTTWRLEDDYNRPDETPEERLVERGEV